MNVDELISLLLKCDKDKEVLVNNGYIWTNIKDVVENNDTVLLYFND